MRVRILGTAAGGGLPQWNCGCPGCDTARMTGGGRTQDCLAITGDGSVWYLVNASADLRAQLLAAPELAPARHTRDPPLGGVLLTSGELDHTLGLLNLREAAGIEVYATPTVRAALPFAAALAAYTTVRWHPVVPGRPIPLAGGLTALAFAPGAKPPRYAGAAPGAGWTVAYRFTKTGTDTDTGTGTGTGGLVYAPGLARWTPEFAAGVAGADVALLDGTFATADEFGDGAAMGHLSIEDTLVHLAAHPGPEYVFTHLNNTNPYAHAGADVTDRLAAVGARIAMDGEILRL
jgi:pyrroloquinoline quinone biosynthesis protein B